MKTQLSVLCCLTTLPALAQVIQPGGPPINPNPPSLIETGPDYRLWQTPAAVRSPNSGSGRVVEMGTGMNHFDGARWTESVPVFELDPNDRAFVANHVQHRVRLNSDINVTGAVGIATPEGQLLYSTPVGIGLYDGVSGQFLLIATITNTPGVLVGTNQVYYENAFRGGACASILYTVEKDSFSQDIVFSGYLDPAKYGFPTNSTRIQIITEFFQPPMPDIVRQPMYIEGTPQTMVSPEVMDETLSFDRLVMGVGQAYTLPSLLEPKGAGTLVAKEFTKTTDGRYFLVESVPYRFLQQGFYTLPDCPPTGLPHASIRRGSLKNVLAGLPVAPPKTKLAAIPDHNQHASLSRGHSPLATRHSPLGSSRIPHHPSVVIDYTVTLNSGATLLQGDATYLVASAVTCTTLTAEGGAVVKYKVGTSITVNTLTPKNSGLYRPVVFTCVDDDTVGQLMNGYPNSGYTGTITNTGYANPALRLGSLTLNVSGCVFRYAQKVVQYSASSISAASVTLTHAQLYKCVRGIDLLWGGSGGSGGCSPITLTINNALMAQVQYPFYHTNLTCTVNPNLINCTVDQATALVGGSGPLSYNAKNSIYANITNSTSGTFSGNNNGFYSSAQLFGSPQFNVSSLPFQSAGAGNYYLTDASGFRNAGSSSGVSATLIADLGKRTTYPPLITATTTLNVPQTYSPQAQRDTDTLDIGYHYDPLDYALGGVMVTNAIVTINPGTAIAAFGTNNYAYGLAIGRGATLQSSGAPDKPNWIVQFNTVQEQPYTNWFQTSFGALCSEFQGLTPKPVINCRFTDWSAICDTVSSFLATTNTGPFNFQDCEFHGGSLGTIRPTINLTNCLLERTYVDLEPKDGLTTFWRVGTAFGATIFFGPSNSVVQDVLFDNCASMTNWNGYNGGFNAYVTGLPRLQPTKTTDLVLSTGASYQAGPFGNYYQLTNSAVVNWDTNTTANLVGLYHYATTTNLVSGIQIKERATFVDVSFHYVAADSNGKPIDSDGDGVPDYFEDTNGDEFLNSGETSPDNASDLGLKVWITEPKRNANLP